MMTIVGRVTLKTGVQPTWDGIMRERLEAVRDQPGWIGAQILIPVDALDQRVTVGSWESRADWQAWHQDEAFRETRRQLEGPEAAPPEEAWHEVIAERRAA